MSAAEFNAIIFRIIGIEYQGIISSLNMRVDPVTFNELHSQLVSHEILLKSNTDTYTANFAYRPPLLPTLPTSHSFSSSHPSQHLTLLILHSDLHRINATVVELLVKFMVCITTQLLFVVADINVHLLTNRPPLHKLISVTTSRHHPQLLVL